MNNNNNNSSSLARSTIYGGGNSHKKTISISDNLIQLGPPLEVNSSDNDPESPYTANTDVMLPFEFSTGLDHTVGDVNRGSDAEDEVHFPTADGGADDTLKMEDHEQQYFDFNAFINFDQHHYHHHRHHNHSPIQHHQGDAENY